MQKTVEGDLYAELFQMLHQNTYLKSKLRIRKLYLLVLALVL